MQLSIARALRLEPKEHLKSKILPSLCKLIERAASPLEGTVEYGGLSRKSPSWLGKTKRKPQGQDSTDRRRTAQAKAGFG